MTVRRAALISTLVAALVYLPSLRNGFALDDGPIVEQNPVAHSVPAALGAVMHPYWPPPRNAGLWRPLVILSFAADWQLSGGSTAWLHATNVALHALVTALLVFVLAGYLAPAGALAGGLVFAVHPVHVEAVANLVGRAELMAALFLLAALLLARQVRRRAAEHRPTLVPEVLLLLSVTAALLSKEHAAIAVALVLLDDRARDSEAGRLPLRVIAGTLVITAAWLVLRHRVEQGAGFAMVAPTFLQIDTAGRLSTMMPVVLIVLRLLAWPFDLSFSYEPLIAERLEWPGPAGILGLLVLLALALLAVIAWRRHRAASVGLLAMGLAWLPTSNLLFATGIVLSERTLYLPSAGFALLVGLLASAAYQRFGARATMVAVAVVIVAFSARSLARIPVWRSTPELSIVSLLEHPESYRAHQSQAQVFWTLGLKPQALAEYGVAAEIYPLDYNLLAEMASARLGSGQVKEALALLRRAERFDSSVTTIQQLLAQALLRRDSSTAALMYARRAVASGPKDPESARMLAASMLALGQADSALAVWPAFEARGGSRFERLVLEAVTFAAVGQSQAARTNLDAARSLAVQAPAQRRLREAEAVVEASTVQVPKRD